MVNKAAAEPIEVFFSYSHRDEELRDEVAKSLSLLKRQGVIKDWHDRKITAGSEWEKKIDEHLESAKIILLLIRSDFLASDYCYDRTNRVSTLHHEELRRNNDDKITQISSHRQLIHISSS
jgi:hypothetical protein